MITTAPMIQVVDWLYPCSPIQIDTRPVLCRGYKCQCREFARWRTVANYLECQCGHSDQTHKLATKTKKRAKR